MGSSVVVAPDGDNAEYGASMAADGQGAQRASVRNRATRVNSRAQAISSAFDDDLTPLGRARYTSIF
jgi:hypothetical protein